MSKKTNIDQQITEFRHLTKSGAYEQAREAADALSKRRLSKEQRAEYEQIMEGLDESEDEGYTMSGQLRKYRERYQTSVTHAGNKSLNNGDDLAGFLEMKTPKEVCELADRFTPIKGGETHMERYQKLNPGQQRMNAGNKLRAAMKNGKIIITEDGIQAN